VDSHLKAIQALMIWLYEQGRLKEPTVSEALRRLREMEQELGKMREELSRLYIAAGEKEPVLF